jgi:OST-HTH/LOTUS domain
MSNRRVASADQLRKQAAEFMQSAPYTDLLLYGIAPDGSVEWNFAGIVRALREGHRLMSQGGWAALDAVSAWVLSTHPEHTPQRYGCVSWPQVLHESALFQIQYRKAEGGRNVAWFRERTERPR